MARPLKHLLLSTTEDPYAVKAWSGIPYSLRTALDKRVERVSVFRPPPPSRNPLDSIKRLSLGARRYPLWITRASLQQNAQSLQEEIGRLQPDAVLSISSQTVAFLEEPGVPVFLFSDAPYLAFCEAYAQWETYPDRINEFALEEAAAGRRLDGLCFGSNWACEEAARLYGLPSDHLDRLYVTPLGANWVPKMNRTEIERRIDKRTFERIELLYVGRDWERKGGPLAVEITRMMRSAGFDTYLHVVGCRPELGEDSAPGGFIKVHGPLYQDDSAESARLAELFLSSHFLVVPTLAECFGIVFAEAQAFGLPPVSRNVHALPSVVADGVTGLLLDRNDPASAYVERMVQLVTAPNRYREMAHRARQRFESTLNWDATASAIAAAIEGALAG